MKIKATEKIVQDDNADTTQIYRLICIHNPGRKTGRQTGGMSATAVVPTGEQNRGSIITGPEPPVRAGNLSPAVPAELNRNTSCTPAGSGDFRAFISEKSENCLPGIPAGHENHQPEIPAVAVTFRPQEAAGNEGIRSGSPAPENIGGCFP